MVCSRPATNCSLRTHSRTGEIDLVALVYSAFTRLSNFYYPFCRLRCYSFRTGLTRTIIGKQGGGCVDGDVADALLNRPRGLAELSDGSILVVDSGNAAIRLLDRGLRRVETIVRHGGLIEPWGIAVVKEVNNADIVYVTDRAQHCIFRLEKRKPPVRQ